MKVTYKEPLDCHRCVKIRGCTEPNSAPCAECEAARVVHVAEVLEFCPDNKAGVNAVLLRDDGKLVVLPLRHNDIYVAGANRGVPAS